MKVFSLRAAAPALVLSFSLPVFAAEGIHWDKASLSYVTADAEGADLSGLALSGSHLLDDNLFMHGRIESISDDVAIDGTNVDLDVKRFSLGLGYRHALSPLADVFGVVSYENIDLTVSVPVEGVTFSVGDSVNGLSFELGLRGYLNEQFEVGASIKQWRMNVPAGEDGSDSGLHLFADYHFNERYAVGLARSSMEDITFTEIKGTMFF